MDGKAEEHIVEVAGVLSRYCDLIAMRAFPGFKTWCVFTAPFAKFGRQA